MIYLRQRDALAARSGRRWRVGWILGLRSKTKYCEGDALQSEHSCIDKARLLRRVSDNAVFIVHLYTVSCNLTQTLQWLHEFLTDFYNLTLTN